MILILLCRLNSTILELVNVFPMMFQNSDILGVLRLHNLKKRDCIHRLVSKANSESGINLVINPPAPTIKVS